MKIDKQFLTPNKYSRPQIPLKKVKKIAVHYVGNAGSTAKGNRDYFESLKNGRGVYASSHYIIGLEGEIIQCIPENEWSYATNDANGYSISIENCHPDSTGKFTDATLKSLIDLCVDICKRYNLDPLTDIIRHYDVNGKKCPLYWVTHPQEFIQFKETVNKILKGDELSMTQYQELKQENEQLKQQIADLKEKTYNTLEEVPQWGRTVVHDLIDRGYIKGTDKGLNITDTLLRMLVITDRAGLYKD